MISTTLSYSFTEQEMQRASDEWGANCGPSALAFILQTDLESLRDSIPGFDTKRYTSPMMMKYALANLGKTFTTYHGKDGKPSKATMFGREPALVCVQWTGPWTKPGVNPRWAYRQTHWIVTYMVELQAAMVFDCNGGIRGFQSWEKEIVPILTALYKRADGGWFPTHVWRIN